MAQAKEAAAVAIAAGQLWPMLQRCDALGTFSDHERESFLHAFEHEYGMVVRRFAPGDLICRRGEFELDLCIVLDGRAEVHDRDDRGVEVHSVYEAGSIFGELGAMGGRPRSFDVAADVETLIFYIPRHALKYLEINERARAILAERYRERAVRAMTGRVELFATVPETFIDELIPHCQILRFDLRGVPVVQQGEEVDGFYIILDGFVQVVRHREDGQRRVLAYLREGEFFGEMALLGGGRAWGSAFTAGKCELIKIDREGFTALCARYPATERAMHEVIARQQEQENSVTAELSDLLEKSGQLGVIQSDALLVMDLDRCIKCDNCVRACESLHGRSRLIRNGVQIGKYLVPSACRHCDDPKCMNACPTGAVRRRPEGEIYFKYDQCIGCGNCAIACPFDNITMIDTPSFDKAQARKSAIAGGRGFFRPYPVTPHGAAGGLLERLLGRGQESEADAPAQEGHGHIPPSFPIKCDLCDGLPFMGCVHSCPTGAAIRIEAAELFEEFHAVSAKSHIRKAHDGD
ncbi:MAG TPA: cyclic nucleotide-binding domain-containing protein [Candidatus Binataceae bacterium]|jgi:CRP-like cAMP-binding protein/Fe-S-cluster-containing hydrogenase component 2|nr:cyclic nucleotide-binding domain-containing protein [Candidatus Binataceae bacterium]